MNKLNRSIFRLVTCDYRRTIRISYRPRGTGGKKKKTRTVFEKNKNNNRTYMCNENPISDHYNITLFVRMA